MHRQIIFLLPLFFARTSLACTCADIAPSAEWYNSFDAVFTAEVTGSTIASDPNAYDLFSINVSEIFKGGRSNYTEITAGDASCKWNLTTGATYTFFAFLRNDNDDLFDVGLCSPSDYTSSVDLNFVRQVFPCADVPPFNDNVGWNGSSTCELTTAQSNPVVVDGIPCIDTDGDGWGWNGMSSCVVHTINEAPCIDTDGDGWGWDGQNSCIVSNEPSGICIDTDGDGWGWDGEMSCLP